MTMPEQVKRTHEPSELLDRDIYTRAEYRLRPDTVARADAELDSIEGFEGRYVSLATDMT